ncbi:NADPH-dependent FMN reductase [Thioalkalivibrio nitratireducens DSM 14787]|uniref:NADPH-dependent FMN reductase n=1 Tax=Thioalkalivibrio nitratireducens (strain DSM 14787 / UNIQEM 213 / ALEN2) TaxID=1255043 RepID=L0E0G0_THIND|nr:NADPH-dependent FMN reductase [Thioalkalivibrio nitratireducens DSM 14787]
MDTLHLREAAIEECIGCFQCLKTGTCCHRDDMDAIIERMLAADGFVVLGPVRNGHVAAGYKRFYERITYRVGFPLLIEDKYTLAISSVGYMGGKAASRRFLGLQDVCHSRLSGHLHFAVGIPSRPIHDRQRARICAAVDRLLRDIERKKARGWINAAGFALDRFAMRRLMFAKKPDVYANVIRHWREKGYMR